MVEPTAPDKMTFGAALEELEGIVRALEGGQLELEESLAQYERGVSLLAACQKKLGEAQQRVTMLMGQIEGQEVPGATGDAPGEEIE